MNYNKVRADSRREELARYKEQQGCADCGYSEHHVALEFDHLPGTDKKCTVASLMYHSWAKIWQEVKKCEVVCANCHAIRTHQRR